MGQENNQIVIIFVLSAAFVVLLAILLILFVLVYQKRLVNQEIKLQKLQNERQKVLLKASIEGQERERERLAKELHDGIGSLLSGLSLHLKFHKSKEKDDSDRAKFLAEACKLVEEGLDNVRTVSHNLLPSTLDRFGLISAMQECIEPINKNMDLKINLHTNIVDRSILPKDAALGLLRIFQELVQNTIKHSGATIVDIIVQYDQKMVHLKYTDNGKGLDKYTTDNKGIGIKNIRSRTQSLEGEVSITSNLNTGFEAEITVPIMHKSHRT